ncbi:MAG: hypothetical protein ACMXYD_03635 [Candidatus Woesearchaeota archaeon]
MSIEDALVSKQASLTGFARYKRSVKDLFSILAPSLALSALAMAGVQEGLGYIDASNAVVVAGGYASAITTGYTYFLLADKRKTPAKYPSGLTKQSLLAGVLPVRVPTQETFRTIKNVFISDMPADYISYSPVIIGANEYLLSNGVSEGLSGLIAGGVASTTYYFTFCGLYPHAQKVTDRIGRDFQAAKHVFNSFSEYVYVGLSDSLNL